MRASINKIIYLLLSLILFVCCGMANGGERFPRPQFNETDYTTPFESYPAARMGFLVYLDVIVLVAALFAGAYLLFRRRSRIGLWLLAVFGVAYFGFYREGCVCAVGSLQNVSAALFDSQVGITVAAVLFFTIPLIFTLFFGRVFCAGVCPLGALQEILLIKPLPVARWLDRVLRIFPHVYLAAAVVFAVTGAGYIICSYDPFVPVFRMSGSVEILVIAGCLVLLSMICGRPYCRYVCPYGVLLGACSKLAKYRTKIAPTECIKCHLCANACPYEAINTPDALKFGSNKSRERLWLAVMIILTPVFMVVSGWLFSSFSDDISRAHYLVRTAEAVTAQRSSLSSQERDLADGYEKTGKPVAELLKEVEQIKGRFHTGLWLAGLYLGFIFGFKMIGYTMRRKRDDYEAEPGLCYSCARCFDSCPVSRKYAKENGQQK